LLDAIGINLERFLDANAKNRQLYDSFGLGNSYFFDKETWGADKLVKTGNAAGRNNQDSRMLGGMTEDFVARTPLADQARKDLIRIYTKEQPDYMSGLTSAEKQLKLAKMSYSDYLLNVAKVDKQCLWFVQHTGEGNFCVGADAIPALFATQGYNAPG